MVQEFKTAGFAQLDVKISSLKAVIAMPHVIDLAAHTIKD